MAQSIVTSWLILKVISTLSMIVITAGSVVWGFTAEGFTGCSVKQCILDPPSLFVLFFQKNYLKSWIADKYGVSKTCWGLGPEVGHTQLHVVSSFIYTLHLASKMFLCVICHDKPSQVQSRNHIYHSCVML